MNKQKQKKKAYCPMSGERNNQMNDISHTGDKSPWHSLSLHIFLKVASKSLKRLNL